MSHVMSNLEIREFNINDIEELYEVELTSFTDPWSKESFKDGNIDIISIVHQAGLASSRSEARRAVEQGGVSVNGEKVSAIDAVFAMELFEDGVVVKKGKKNFRKVTV